MRSIKEVQAFLKQHSPEELIAKYKELCTNSKNNTYITVNNNMSYDPCLKDKKLFCIPIAIKDNICIKDMPATCASKMLENFIPNYTATVVKKLLNEGAIIVGKTNMDEFAMGASSTNGYFGPVINPTSTDKPLIAGGSSGGSAAAVSEGSAILSLGSDTGGSVRYPAALCNIVGIKPTYGRCSRYGLIAFSSSLDQVGPFANNVQDAARILDVISGTDINDMTSSQREYETDLESHCGASIKNKKVGIIKEFMESKNLSQEARGAFNASIQYLTEAGCSIMEFSVPEILEYSLQCYHIQSAAEASSNLARYDGIRYGYNVGGDSIESIYKNNRTEGFGNEVKRRIISGNNILSRENFTKLYTQSKHIVAIINDQLKNIFAQVNVLMTPIALSKAFPIDNIPDPIALYEQDIFTSFVNLTGLGAISLPVNDLAVQIVCNYFCEEDLISFASAIEARNRLSSEANKQEKESK